MSDLPLDDFDLSLLADLEQQVRDGDITQEDADRIAQAIRGGGK